jgi:hypothetical protein
MQCMHVQIVDSSGSVLGSFAATAGIRTSNFILMKI